MVDVSTSPTTGIVQSRDRATLHSIIQQHTLPNTVVHTDEWAAYGRMTSLPNITSHAVVNHSLHFVDPVTGIHTNNVESYVLESSEEEAETHDRHQLPSYLDEFMWMEHWGGTNAFNNIIYVPTSAHSTPYKLLLNLQIYISMIVLLCNELNKSLMIKHLTIKQKL